MHITPRCHQGSTLGVIFEAFENDRGLAGAPANIIDV